ncbi:hypothetical protein L596_026108 [Steinernema carpocapsae]|uniref:Uncharacterized protein n=1 Tax=Steinernema carpocapsae TaxID=34508 RepID=A0A4U5M0D9_STECR|nr:hypothetical protein L596_026108 [Steinernema carpocapsae]
MQDGHRPFPVSILNFPISLPEIDRREPHSKCLAKTLHFIQQIAFVLNIKDHFGVTEVIAQEKVAKEFDKAYLNSIGISTPPADQCDIQKRVLETTKLC